MTTFQLTGDDKGQTLVIVYEDQDIVTVPDTHKNFDAIIDLWRSKDYEEEDIRKLVNNMHEIGKRLSAITERVSVAPYGVFFDGDPLRGELADFLLEMYNEERIEDFTAVANFLEKAATNPSIESIDALYQWITNGDLVITPNGDFVAYKGVKVGAGGQSMSITSGSAFVNGILHNGCIPNPDGAIITMPRSEVNANGSVGCSTGLHAGTYDYASGFAQGRLLIVQINPRDVVSVPNDCSFQKLRVSRYTVLSHIENKLESRLYNIEEDDGDFVDDSNLSEENEVEDSNCGLCDESEENCLVGDPETCDYKDQEKEEDTVLPNNVNPWTLTKEETVTRREEKPSGLKSAFNRFIKGD